MCENSSSYFLIVSLENEIMYDFCENLFGLVLVVLNVLEGN